MANEVIMRRYLDGSLKQETDEQVSVGVGSDEQDAEDNDEQWRQKMALKLAKARTRTKPAAKKKGDGGTRAVGRTSEKSVKDTWLSLFQKNARLPKSQKMTDEAILKEMLREFPGKSGQDYTVGGVHNVRRWWNQGGRTGEKHDFLRYDANGDVLARISTKTGGRPKGSKDEAPRARKGATKPAFKIKVRKTA